MFSLSSVGSLADVIGEVEGEGGGGDESDQYAEDAEEHHHHLLHHEQTHPLCYQLQITN